MKTERLFVVMAALLMLAGCAAEVADDTSGAPRELPPEQARQGQQAAAEDIDLHAEEDIAIYDDALLKRDDAACAKIFSPELRADCLAEIDLRKTSDLEMEKTQQEVKEKSELVNRIVAGRDVAGCKEVGAEQVFACEMNILPNLALEKTDPTICEQASEEETVKICKSRYEELI